LEKALRRVFFVLHRREDLEDSPFIFHSLEKEGKHILLNMAWIEDYGGVK
jgi:hypothetical protein